MRPLEFLTFVPGNAVTKPKEIFYEKVDTNCRCCDDLSGFRRAG